MKKSDLPEEESNMKIYAIIDTNVIISALLSRHTDSATVQILDHLFDKTLIPVYNEEILNEYSAVLRRAKFNFSEHLINATLDAIKQSGISSERIASDVNLPDPKDIVFYEITLSVDGAYLVTGKIKHFPKKPFIVTPTEMVQIINEMLYHKPGLLSEPPMGYGKHR